MSISTDQHSGDATRKEDRAAVIIVGIFPLFILGGAVLAYFFPAPFLPMREYITYFLMIIMFSMGLTLTLPDFAEVLRRPFPIILGVILQFTIMPAAALFVAWALDLNTALTLGLLMLGTVPGGTTSNVVAYLARGDVALSVTMTSVSTLLSPIVTPALMLLLASAETEVDGLGMAKSLAQTVLLPVIGGLVIRYLFDGFINRIAPILPLISIVGIGGVVFPTVAGNGDLIVASGWLVILAVLLHNVIGYVLGYLGGRVFRLDERANRTMSIEVSTQSAGLASGMAGKFFSPEAALPGAVAAVLHNITGAVYAAIMRRIPLPGERVAADGERGVPAEVTA